MCKILRMVCRMIHRRRKGHGIVLLVPFRTDNDRREETWEWLREYWKHELPGAKIIMGRDDHVPFCKTAAVNHAAKMAKGDIFVILDADCYIRGGDVLWCAKQIRKAKRHGHKLWYLPYRHFYRLTDEASRIVLDSDPESPFRFSSPPPDWAVESKRGSGHGHWFGALIQVMPREAFELLRGMDERFNAGWGSEDSCFMHALDTLYAKHKTSDNDVLHLWHPSIGSGQHSRKWEGQEGPMANTNLAMRYHHARGDREKMQRIIDER
jgi:predicted glycosyltransferase involved in capsule biosynthesis